MEITKLEEVYCVPDTDDELNHFGCSEGVHIKWDEPSFKGHNGLSYHYKEVFGIDMNGRKQIPVQHFHDLLQDKIVPWRLEEVGFTQLEVPVIPKPYKIKIVQHTLFYDVKTEMVALGTNPLNITAFSELFQMMKFLGYKFEK